MEFQKNILIKVIPIIVIVIKPPDSFQRNSDIEIKTTFQSRFGPQEWLQPYTDKTFENLPKEGKKNILVICPGFSSDCVETLEEISIQGKESFIKSGGDKF